MKLFQCSIIEKGWMQDHILQRDHILAIDADDARRQICARWGCRKNAKGLRIIEIPFTQTTRTARQYDTTVRGEYHWMTDSYSQVKAKATEYRCKRCNHIVGKADTFCGHCGAYFTDKF